MIGRMLREDRTQPRLCFKAKGDNYDTKSGNLTQGATKEVEGGDDGLGGSIPPSDIEEAQWEDMEGDTAAGRETKEARLSPGRRSYMPGRTTPPQRSTRRGFWLGRKAKLKGEASKKQNT